MWKMNKILQPFRLTGPLLQRRCLVGRGVCTTEHAQELNEELSEHIDQQILRAGLHYLRGDIEALRENAVNRGSDTDIDKLVCTSDVNNYTTIVVG